MTPTERTQDTNPYGVGPCVELLSSLKEGQWGWGAPQEAGLKIPRRGFSRIRKWKSTDGRGSCLEGVSQQVLHLLLVTVMTTPVMCKDFISRCELSRDEVRAVSEEAEGCTADVLC